jgi:hypothetical protein
VCEQAKPLELVGGFALLASVLPNAERQVNDSCVLGGGDDAGHQDAIKPLQHLVAASVLNVATHKLP